MADRSFYDYVMGTWYFLWDLPLIIYPVTYLYYTIALALPVLVMVFAFRRGVKLRRAMEARLTRTADPSWGDVLRTLFAPLIGTLMPVLYVVLIGAIVVLYSALYHNDGTHVGYGWITAGWLVRTLWDQFILGFYVAVLPQTWKPLAALLWQEYVVGMLTCDAIYLPMLTLMWATRWAVAAVNLQIILSVLLLLIRLVRKWWTPRPSAA